MAKHFDFDYYNSLPKDLQKRLLECCSSGAENHDSGMGMYAMNPEDYDLFKPYMDVVCGAHIREICKVPMALHVLHPSAILSLPCQCPTATPPALPPLHHDVMLEYGLREGAHPCLGL